MRKNYFVLLTVLLAISLVLSMSACSKTDADRKDVSAYQSPEGITALRDPLNRADIDAFPIKDKDMSIDEARQLCVDFFRFSKTALWVAGANIKYTRNAAGIKDSLTAGQVYGGLPYVGLGTGNVYRLLDYIDPATGVLDIDNAADVIKIFGNQCSIGSYWGWARCINSTDYVGTPTMVQSNNFYPVGPYTYDDSLKEFVPGMGTVAICTDNGEQTMYASYAQLKTGDGLVWFTAGGHALMCASDAYVVYGEDGVTIDPEASYITTIDQGQVWKDGVTADGQPYKFEGSVDTKRTFAKLYAAYMIPFTYGEWLGTDPIEDTEISFSHSGEAITIEELFSSEVTANYGIADIYAIVRDSTGREVYKHAIRCLRAHTLALSFIKEAPAGAEVDNVERWGSLEDLKASENYTVQIIAQLGTGERPVLWEGALSIS